MMPSSRIEAKRVWRISGFLETWYAGLHFLERRLLVDVTTICR